MIESHTTAVLQQDTQARYECFRRGLEKNENKKQKKEDEKKRLLRRWQVLRKRRILEQHTCHSKRAKAA